MAAARAAATSPGRDRAIVLWLGAAILVAIILFSIFGTSQEDNDPEPTTYNSGSHGMKAALLLLPRLGYPDRRLETPLSALHGLDPAQTTLILTEPILPVKGLKPLQAEIAAFLAHGGRVIATGRTGAELLPDGQTDKPTRILEGLCFTIPEGGGALAAAGQLSIDEPVRWSAEGPQFRVEQRCGRDAAVVSYRVGQGEAIWLSSPMPLTNAGLNDDASLKLLLAALGRANDPTHAPAQPRTVLFDEYLHETRESITDTLRGLPWWPLAGQLAILAVLLVLSRGRRAGPLRRPIHLPRSSPIEFAQSMGRLYSRAGATEAATGAAYAKLVEYLRDQCGIAREILHQPAPAVSHALSERFGGDWNDVETHLHQAHHSGPLSPKSALQLVQSLEADHQRLQQQILNRRQQALVTQ